MHARLPAIGLTLLLVACATAPSGPPKLHDPALAAHVQQLVCRIVTPCTAYPVLLVDRREPQAEVLPDGRVALRLGLLLAVEEEAELVFVLAHEIAHRQLGHAPPEHEGERMQLELEADAVALQALRRLGYADDAGFRLITRLVGPGVDDMQAARQIDARLQALPRGPERESQRDARLDRLLVGYR